MNVYFNTSISPKKTCIDALNVHTHYHSENTSQTKQRIYLLGERHDSQADQITVHAFVNKHFNAKSDVILLERGLEDRYPFPKKFKIFFWDEDHFYKTYADLEETIQKCSSIFDNVKNKMFQNTFKGSFTEEIQLIGAFKTVNLFSKKLGKTPPLNWKKNRNLSQEIQKKIQTIFGSPKQIMLCCKNFH